MTKAMTKMQYEAQAASCNNLCDITDTVVSEEPTLMMCVTCPFCKALVNATLTTTTISCPACQVSVNRVN